MRLTSSAIWAASRARERSSVRCANERLTLILVFLVLFSYFRVPPVYQHKVLFYGVLGAMIFSAEIGYAGRFGRGRQLGKFSGLTPTSHESGEQSDHKGHISRQGPPRLRKMLCQASWVHIQHDKEARDFYMKLVDRNPKKKKIAIVAVMRRLAVRLWHRMREAELEMTKAV
jgi:hypothetical protein